MGLRVIATARRLEAMAGLAAAGITTLHLDVTDPESIARVKTEVMKITGGTLDILMNSAGLPQLSPAIDIELASAKAIFDANFWGPVQTVQAFAPLLIAAAQSRTGWGARIVNIGSTAGIAPVPFSAVYNASKAALHSFSDTLRVELAPFNVKVTSVSIYSLLPCLADPDPPLQVIAGGVSKTTGLPSGTLAEDSLYRPMEAIYQAKRVNPTVEMMSPHNFAKSIVADALAPRPHAWLWTGYMAWVIWLLSTFGGRRIFESVQEANEAKTDGKRQHDSPNPRLPHARQIILRKLDDIVRRRRAAPEHAAVAVAAIEEVTELEHASNEDPERVPRGDNLARAAQQDRDDCGAVFGGVDE
ncbi:hypothetical protein HWV62_24163 [Athelia sp. TMB]|nr:hypothetical protein HWV62_24163 [Athelia sp. TMB]